jgi:hypothetical protein
MDNILRSKKVKILLAFTSLLLLVNSIQDSYAKYVSSASANGNFTIAEWTFKVNDQDILNESDFSSTIVPVIDANPNIKEGVIAPTSKGYFDVIVDHSRVGVSYKQDITLSYGEDSITDMVFTGYTLNGGEVTDIGETNTVSVVHNLSDESTIDVYRFYVEWIDGTGETMNNQEDTEASANGTTSVKIDLHFIQQAN